MGGGSLESFVSAIMWRRRILCRFGPSKMAATQSFVYPLLEAKTGALISAANLRVAPNLRHLHAYLIENRFIENLRDYDESVLSIFSRDVLQRLRSGDKSWESMVPPQVAQMIRERNLFGCKGVC